MLIMLKLLLGISNNDTSRDEILSILLHMLTRKCLAYCNRKDLPVDMEDLIIEMTASLYKTQYASQFEIDGAIANISGSMSGIIKSKTVGDVKIEYETGAASSSTSTNPIQCVMDDYSIQLNNFRRPKMF